MTFGDPDWFSAENIRKRASVIPETEAAAYGALGYFMHQILNPEPAPGPPYVHTLTLPQQPVFSRSGKLVYRPPDRTAAFTIGEIRPPGQRIEVTYLTDGP